MDETSLNFSWLDFYHDKIFHQQQQQKKKYFNVHMLKRPFLSFSPEYTEINKTGKDLHVSKFSYKMVKKIHFL